MGKLPKEWIGCPKIAKDVICDKFIVCKTPLSDNFDRTLPPHEHFKPHMILSSDLCRQKRVGLWIDLTNTDRYYNPRSIHDAGCRYKKIICRGHYETPTYEQTKQFIDTVSRFSRYHPNKLVVVHCTHGFNRTGFLIVSYLVEKMHLEVDTAVNMFAGLRPPGIYKACFINALFRRYGDVRAAPKAPLKPVWCEQQMKHYRRNSSHKSRSR